MLTNPNAFKSILKGAVKAILLPLVGIALVIIICVSSLFVQDQKAFEESAVETETYTGNATMDVEQGIVVKTTDENGEEKIVTAEGILENLDYFQDYLEDDENSTKAEKLNYLMNAELVTKFPYIDSLANDESKLNGVVRFYRYTNEVEAIEGAQEDWEWEEGTDNNQSGTNSSQSEIDLSSIFYIGDSWMVGLQNYIESYAPQEYPGSNYFLCEEGLSPTNGKYSNENLKNSIDQLNPSTIVVMLGLNDRSEASSDRMKKIIEFLSETYSNKTIYVLRLPHVGQSYTYGNNFDATKMNKEIDDYNAILLQECSSKSNVKFINTTDNMVNDDFLDEVYCLEDGLHLNDTGIAMWYQNIKDSISLGRSSTDVGKFRMVYINETDFQNMYDEYERTGNREVYKYFTLDEENNVIVAYGSQETRTVTTNDPEVTLDVVNGKSTQVYGGSDGTYTTTTYTASQKKIDYYTLIEPYVMPFNLLAALLVQTDDYEFTAEIAKLAYDSKICIGIYDNQTITVKNDVYTYNKSVRYTENTSLNFDNISGSDPEIDINSSKYSSVQKNCFGFISGNEHIHAKDSSNFLTDYSRRDGSLHKTFVTEMSGDGIITGVTENQSNGYAFKTNYNMTKNANSTPSVGVVLADIWVGKWEVSYKQKDNNSNASSSEGNQEDESYIAITRERFSDALLDAANGAIGVNLTPHSESLKNDAINTITNNTEFETSPRSMTVQDIRTCASICSACYQALQNTFGDYWKSDNVYYIGDEALRSAVANAGNSGNTLNHVKAHVQQRLSDEATTANAQKIENFKEFLNNRITYDQWPTAQKANVNIGFVTTNTRTSTIYEKNNTEMTNIGAKFKQTINDPENYEAKQLILRLTDWFWENIRKTENTAKLENLIRYMFNIAFDTDQFGTFTEEEIQNLFEVFEPQEMTTTGKLYGNTIEAKVWFALRDAGYSEFATAGVMGNLWKESNFKSNNLENKFESILGYTDETYTEAINNGTYSLEEFMYDHDEDHPNCGAGYGLAQWTYCTRKEGLYKFSKDMGVSIDDEDLQIEYLLGELSESGGAGGNAKYMLSGSYNGYTADDWLYAESPEEAAEAFCWMFERPGGYDATEREEKAREYYTMFHGKTRPLGAENILTMADELHQQQIEWTYGAPGGGDIVGAINGKYGNVTVCATYVSSVLYLSGCVEEEEVNSYNYNWCGDVYRMLERKRWQIIDNFDLLEPGDVVFTQKSTSDFWNLGPDELGHVQIYAGDGLWYSAGSSEEIQRPQPYNSNNWSRANFAVALRAM